jgi:hypothetical protein
MKVFHHPRHLHLQTSLHQARSIWLEFLVPSFQIVVWVALQIRPDGLPIPVHMHCIRLSNSIVITSIIPLSLLVHCSISSSSCLNARALHRNHGSGTMVSTAWVPTSQSSAMFTTREDRKQSFLCASMQPAKSFNVQWKFTADTARTQSVTATDPHLRSYRSCWELKQIFKRMLYTMC